jgi:peptidoglycan-N-acetylglucosamine deacetylase
MELRPLWWLIRLSRAGHGRAGGVLRVWIWWDRLLDWYWRLRPVHADAFLRYRLARHRGRPLPLRDGTIINKGDPLIELHFDNARLLQRVDEAAWNPWQAFVLIDTDLRVLNVLLASGELPPVRALHGTTLYAAAGPRMGFEARSVPHTWPWALKRFYLIALLAIYHPNGWSEVDRMRRNRWPAELWMSRAALARRCS